MMSVFLLATMLLGWLFAAYVVTQPDPVRAAFALIGVFCCAATHWWRLQAPFLAILLLLVYLGAVMVFFLFIVMTLPQSEEAQEAFNPKSLTPPLLITALTAPLLAWSLTKKGIHALDPQSSAGFHALGVVLFEQYGVLLQYLGLLLFVAMVVSVAVITAPKEHS